MTPALCQLSYTPLPFHAVFALHILFFCRIQNTSQNCTALHSHVQEHYVSHIYNDMQCSLQSSDMREMEAPNFIWHLHFRMNEDCNTAPTFSLNYKKSQQSFYLRYAMFLTGITPY